MPVDEINWNVLFRLLGKDVARFPTPVAPCHLYKKDGTPKATGFLGWPDLKLVLVMSEEEAKPFTKAGWTARVFPVSSFMAAQPFFRFLEQLIYDRMLRQSRAGAKRRTSEPEQELLREFLRVGLPMPDRNVDIYDDDATWVGTPDFAWSDRLVAVEVDGWWFHGGAELRDAIFARAAEDPDRKKQLNDHDRERSAHDSYKRRVMQAQGWTVLVVADTELAAPGGARRAAEQVYTVWQSRKPLIQPSGTAE